jgi:hypothetical protein
MVFSLIAVVPFVVNLPNGWTHASASGGFDRLSPNGQRPSPE